MINTGIVDYQIFMKFGLCQIKHEYTLFKDYGIGEYDYNGVNQKDNIRKLVKGTIKIIIKEMAVTNQQLDDYFLDNDHYYALEKFCKDIAYGSYFNIDYASFYNNTITVDYYTQLD